MRETHSLLFAPFRLDLGAERLWRGEEARPLTRKAFAALRYLVAHAGQLVTKEELIEAVWAVPYVSDTALAACIHEIRRALNEHAHTPQFVETVRGRGYRFCAPVTVAPPAPERLGVGDLLPEVMRLPGLLVGRVAELAQLQQYWAQAQQGTRQVVVVTGEAGIGKTALVDAFVAQVAATVPAWIGRGQCIAQYGAGETHLPLLEALGQLGRGPQGAHLVALLLQQAPSWLLQLPTLVPEAVYETLQRRGGEVPRERMLRELAEAMEGLTAEQPLVLVLEDLHWSDVSTLDWLAYVARHRQTARLSVIGTYRPTDALVHGHPVHTVIQDLLLHHQGVELVVGYLPAADVRTYLARRFGVSSLPAGLAALLHQRTNGNPLFLVAVVDDLVRQGVLHQALAQQGDDPVALVEAHYSLGTALFYLGEFPTARQHFEQGVTHYTLQRERFRIARAREDPGAACLAFLVPTLGFLGYPDQAWQRADEAWRLAQEQAHPYNLVRARYRAGLYALFCRQAHLAQTLAEEVLCMATSHGFPFYEALATALKGGALVRQEQRDEGLTLLHQGLATLSTTGTQPAPHWLVWQAELYGYVGQPAVGLDLLAEAMVQADTTGNYHAVVELYRLQGEFVLVLSAERSSEAETYCHQALAVAHRQEAKTLELRAAMSLSRLWQRQGKQAAARHLLAEVYGWFTEGFDTADLLEAKALLKELA